MNDLELSQSKALRLLQGLYDRTRGGNDPIFVAELANTAELSVAESEAAWRYLKDRGLIETFNLPYTARINARGIDTIESAKRNPDRQIRDFPRVTYNVVNNTTNIGTAINSPVEQAGHQSPSRRSDDGNEQSGKGRMIGVIAILGTLSATIYGLFNIQTTYTQSKTFIQSDLVIKDIQRNDGLVDICSDSSLKYCEPYDKTHRTSNDFCKHKNFDRVENFPSFTAVPAGRLTIYIDSGIPVNKPNGETLDHITCKKDGVPILLSTFLSIKLKDYLVRLFSMTP